MKIRQLGKTGLGLTELGFGGAAIGNLYRPTLNEEAYAAIIAAWHAGIRYFDTAPSYGYGLSERRMGDALRVFPRESYIISTKVGRLLVPDAGPKINDLFPSSLPFRMEYDYSYDGIMRSVEHSMQRIGTDVIDIVYIDDLGRLIHGDAHQAVLKMLFDGGYRALDELRAQKIIRAIGLGVSEWDVCLEVMPRTNVDCLMLAGRYTLLEQSSLDVFFPECEKRNIQVIAAGPYNSGVLANGQHYDYKIADHSIMTRVNAIQKICDAYQVDLPHAALQFPLRHPQVISVVAGARTEDQVGLSVSYLQQKIPSRLWHALKEEGLITINAPV